LAIWAWGAHNYRSGVSDEREAQETRLKLAEADSLKKAAIAARNADKAGEQRALVEAETRAADLKAIERAEANDTNSLDALFGN
jgi:t-SNARE complex subunit (syntaxin)